LAFAATFEQDGTHHLVPLGFASQTDPLDKLPLAHHSRALLSRLAEATSEHKLAEQGRSLAITPGELLQGVPEAHIVNSAFCHPGLDGGRFHDRRRGAWYAGLTLETSLAEVAFHKRRFLQHARIAAPVPFSYQDFLANFGGQFSHLDTQEQQACLEAHPVPVCYGPGQVLANSLLKAAALGIVYPSVRHAGGTCVACFRPALVFYPRRGRKYVLTIAAGADWANDLAREL
jgi:hypothetical protein